MECEKTRTSMFSNFFINSTLHVLILLLIISSFFFLYVSKLSSNTFKRELGHIIDDNLIMAIRNSDKNGALKAYIRATDLTPWIEHYRTTPDDESIIQNRWLKRVTIFVIIFLIVMFITTVCILKFSCNQKIPLKRILLENIILFSLVGMVEILFFLFIARKFIPVVPSLMIRTIINTLKEEAAKL